MNLYKPFTLFVIQKAIEEASLINQSSFIK